MFRINQIILKTISLTLVIPLFFFGCRKGKTPVEEIKTIKDTGEGTGTTTWTKDKVYILEGFVFINKGQTLSI